MTQHLAESYRTPVTLEQYAETHLSDNDADLNDLPWFILEWEPFDVGYSGKWYRTDEFAAWLSGFCDSGQLFQITQESGGGLWGWEFYQGRYRELELRSKGRWRKGVLPHVT